MRDTPAYFKKDVQKEARLKADKEYAMQELGIEDVYQVVSGFIRVLKSYGHDVSISEVIEKIKELT